MMKCLGIVFIACCCFFAAPVAYALQVDVRTGVHDRYNRMVFDWPEPVEYKFDQQGNQVTIQFTKEATMRLASKAASLPLIRGIQQANTPSGLQVTFQIPDKARIESFRLSGKVAFDVLAMDKSPPKFSEAGITPVPPEAMPKSLPEPPAQEPGKPEAPQEPKVQTLADQISERPPESELENGPEKPAQTLSGIDTVIKIDPKQLTKIAVFSRAGQLWIVLDKALPDFTPVIEGQGFTNLNQNARRIDMKEATAFIFDAPAGGMDYGVTREQTEWRVWLDNGKHKPVPDEMPVNIKQQDKKDAGEEVVIYAGQEPRIVIVQDKLVGDRLWVVPVRSPESRVSQGRSTPDYKFLPTMIGAVIVPIGKQLEIGTQKETVVISARNGKILSSNLADRAKGIKEQKYVSLFDLDEKGDAPFIKQRQALEAAIVAQEDPAQKAGLYAEMAKLNIRNGFGQEATGLLRIAGETFPPIVQDPAFQALQGMAATLSGDFKTAEEMLRTPRLQSQPAAKLWLGYALAMGQKWPEARMAFNDTQDAENVFPEKLRFRFYLAKAQAALDAGDNAAVKKELKKLKAKEELSFSEASALDYTTARLDFLAGKKSDAQAIYSELIEGKDQLYRVKSELDMTAMKLAAKKIKLKDAIETLEGLRFSWRGDRLEIDIMRRLGQYYIDDKNYMEGLTVWRQAAGLSQNTDDTDAITQGMRDVFEKLYVGNEIKNLSPIQAVAIFERFRELTPTGDAGNKALNNLADRLASVDLLDEADALLVKQLRQQQKGEEAALFGAKIAGWRLLSGNADGALKILDETTQEAAITDALSQRRLLLRARALADKNNTDEALAILNASQSPEALSLKADINWRQNRWSDSAMAIQSLVTMYRDQGKTRPDGPTPPLIMKMAIAMTLDDNKQGLALLNAQYGAFMATTASAQAFDLITKASRGSALADLDTLKKQVGEVELFQKFLKGFDS